MHTRARGTNIEARLVVCTVQVSYNHHSLDETNLAVNRCLL